MIKKITNQNQIARHKLAEKINELIDAINNQQIQLNNHECRLLDLHSRISALDDPTYHEEPEEVDGTKYGVSGRRYIYERQSKWIGKLCRFRDNENDKWNYSVLKNIGANLHFPFKDTENYEWGMCELVKPDDDIIYKGGDNE